jgi:hypothetical protein
MAIAAGHCTEPARNNVSEAPVKPCKNGGQKKTEVALCLFLFEPLRRPDRDSIWPLGWYPLTLGG